MRDDAHDAFGAVHEPVRAEAAVARERAPHDVRREVRDDADEQRDEQQPVVVEQRAARSGPERQRATR